MKTGTVLMSGLISAVVLFLTYGYTFAGGSPGDTPELRVGTVSIRDVFRDCKANATYREKAIAEQDKKNAGIDALQKQVEAQEAMLKALKVGSNDYLKQYEELLNQQAKLEATRQFVSQQRVLQDRHWTEVLYKEALRITKELAKQKGLMMVLAVDEPDFPMVNMDELMMVLQTHKVLYSDGCVNLTAQVVAEMDKNEAKLKP